jgi:hypothetical protein
MQHQAAGADSYFPRLRTCVLASFALHVAATILQFSPWLAMVGGGIPLIYYHVGYLWPRARTGLSQAAIDSVYYYGFLVTIAALGISAISLATSGGKTPLNEIAIQFGLGLFATGYAVLARMHLSSISTWVEETSPEAVLDKYAQRSREMVTNVELASEQFVTLTNNLVTKTEQVTQSMHLTAQHAMLEMARMFEEQLRGTLASAREGLTEIRGLMQDTAFVQERQELIRSVKETLHCVAEFNNALRDFGQQTDRGARTSEDMTATTAALNESLADFHGKLEKLTSADGPLLTSAQAVADANRVIADGVRSLSTAVHEMGDMTETVGGMGLTFKNIKSLTLKANEQLASLVMSAERLTNATDKIAQSAQASDALANGLDRTTHALPSLLANLGRLSDQIQSLSTSTVAVETQFKQLPEAAGEMAKLGSEVAHAWALVLKNLSDADTSTQALANNAQTHASALERSQLAATDMESLEVARSKLAEVLNGLADGASAIQLSLESTTTSLQAAVQAAVSSLEQDVKRSSEVSRLFGERMTDVAQIIIERTRDSRPS